MIHGHKKLLLVSRKGRVMTRPGKGKSKNQDLHGTETEHMASETSHLQLGFAFQTPGTNKTVCTILYKFI